MVNDLVKNLCVSLETDIGCVSGATSRKVVVATPVITLTGNSVTITCATTGATIYYTLDGSTPTSSSSQYSSAFTLGSSCTIKAIAIKGGKSSGIAEEEYVKPITYLTQWKIVGNSEVHGQEIWSCGEYSEVDNKWHIRILPEGYGIVDIALDEPLRKVNDVADKIEFADGVATVTRNLSIDDMGDLTYTSRSDQKDGLFIISLPGRKYYEQSGVLCTIYTQISSVVSIASATQNLHDKECCYFFVKNNYNYVNRLFAYDTDYIGATEAQIKAGLRGQKIIYELVTPTTETIQVPQIQEADSYSCVISQGGKAVSWSSFETE